MPIKRVYSENEINKMISLYASGVSLYKIRETLKMDKKNIKNILIDAGVWVENRDSKKFVENYSVDEINNIISKYQNGKSMTAISLLLNIDKRVIKKILKQNNVWIENRDARKIEFNDDEIQQIKHMYLVDGLSTYQIGVFFYISHVAIRRILRDFGVLRMGRSDGKKILFSNEQKNKIIEMYLNEHKNTKEIGKTLNVSSLPIENVLKQNHVLRTRSVAAKLSLTGRIVSEQGRTNMKIAQKNLVLSGKRKQSGGICKRFIVGGIKCHGLSEKSYIETLIDDNKTLPTNCDVIITPFGGYYPDFKYANKYIEIKSTYTYDVLMGIKTSRWTKQYDNKQYNKIKWVNDNIMPVEIIIIDKNKIKKIMGV